MAEELERRHQAAKPVSSPIPPVNRAILYQNDEQTVTLLDIPASIALAQGVDCETSGKTIYSCEPLSQPYQGNEPKSSIAKEQVNSSTNDSRFHASYALIIDAALSEISSEHRGVWCLSRKWSSIQRKKKKQKAGDELDVKQTSQENTDSGSYQDAISAFDDDEGARKGDIVELGSTLTDLAHGGSASVSVSATTMSCQLTMPVSEENADESDGANLVNRRPWDNVFHNPFHRELDLILDVQNGAADGPPAKYRFHIPERSTFVLGDCSKAKEFRETIRYMSQEYETSRSFDFILLDPPWPNASVKRSQAYKTQRNLREIEQLLLRIDLDAYMAPACIVGIWITNKSAVRNSVLGQGGLFEAWNVCLKEEWLWMKTTTVGEPVTPLDGLWRKPYEVLLLGQRPRDPFQIAGSNDGAEGVKRRVIVAVQDLHSRKPCLKELIEPLMADRRNYRALEIFARYLVAGWWSWGDEALKFNWEECWTFPN